MIHTVGARCARIAVLTGVAGVGYLPAVAQAAGHQIHPAATVKATVARATDPTVPGIAPHVPLRVRNPGAYALAKRAASPSPPVPGRSTESPGLSASSSSTAVFGGLNASGLSAAQEIAAFGSTDDVTPPDTTGAIGPSQYIEVVNSELAIYNRADLSMVGSPVALTTFTGGTSPCDPQIKFDPQSGRWFYLALRCDGTTNNNQLFVGWSKTTNPSDLTSSSWCSFSFSSTTPKTSIDDYPKLGLDGTHIIIGSNLFDATGPTGAFQTAHILVAPKPAAGTLSTCTQPTFTVFGSSGSPLTTPAGNAAFTPEPATVADGSSSPGYVVASDLDDPLDTSGSHLMVWHVGGSGSSPTLTADGDISVSSFATPPPVPQPVPAPSTDTLDSLDGRLTQAVAAADPNAGGAEAVWTQHTIQSGTGSVVRWYEVIPSAMTVRQSGTISDAAGFAFNGAIAPTLNGGAVIDYNTGGVSQTVEVKAQSRGPSAPSGGMFTPITLASSAAVDNDFSCPSQGAVGDTSCRWGDYSAASVDPNNPNVVWGSNQVNGPLPAVSADAQWATQTFALSPDLPPTASFTAVPNPATIGPPVGFNAGSSTAPGGVITSYSWSFGDGGTATGVTPAHSYAAAGNYTVTLTVTSDSGQTAATSSTVTVLHRPTASFTVTPSPAFAGSAVRFNGGGSTAPDTTITGYSWSFGDGRTGTGAIASHRYATQRTYTATLTVRDNFGQTAIVTHTVTVRPALHARLTIGKGQKLPTVLARGLKVGLLTNLRTKARFRITTRIRLKGHRKATVVTLMRGRPRAVRRGVHQFTLKLSAAGARRLQGNQSAVLTVRVTLTDTYGQKLTRSARMTLRR